MGTYEHLSSYRNVNSFQVYKERLALAEKRRHRISEELELEYSCLKAIFTIMETTDFKYADFEQIYYLLRHPEDSLEIFSKKHSIRKTITKIDLKTNFRISFDVFVSFLKCSGAKDEALRNKERRDSVRTAPSTLNVAPRDLKPGDYYLCPVTGFWKIATFDDVDEVVRMKRSRHYTGDRPDAGNYAQYSQ